jgi:hypothetical protein
MKQNRYVTSDPYLAAAITEQLQIDPTPVVQNGWTHFCYPVSDKLYEAVNAFNSGIALNAFDYSQTIKRLRGIAITKRKETSDERGADHGHKTAF